MVLHSLPIGFSLDDAHGVRDPRGMLASTFGVDMHVVTVDAAPARNLLLAVENCHLAVEAMVAGPYVASLATLADDEADLGAAVVDMGAGTTTLAVFSDGRFVHADGFTLGGRHLTRDIARGLGISMQNSERIKTLYGSVLLGGADEREMITVPTVSGEDREAPRSVSRAALNRIVKPRAEEILELVRDRLAASPFAAEPRGRVVLTGGACQLTGLADLAARIIGRARPGRTAARYFWTPRGCQGFRFRGVGGTSGLSAARAFGAFRTATHAALQGGDRRLRRAGGTMASRELLTTAHPDHRNLAAVRPTASSSAFARTQKRQL